MNRLVTSSFAKLLFACCAFVCTLHANAQPNEFSFGVIAHSFNTAPDESALREAIAETDANSLAFVVANGIKAATEPCSDAIYLRRKELLGSAKNGLIVSLAASDWSECKTAHGRSAAVERLNRVRELFFTDEWSFGSSRIPLVRQSASAKFRSYSENARWEIGHVMFATVNLPADNNHYRPEAGRNSEFEDRSIANRDWVQRLFSLAAHKKMSGIVLFCDGDPLTEPGGLQSLRPGPRRDGFAEIRKHIGALAAKYGGKVLLAHGRSGDKPSTADGIAWNNNIGNLEVNSGWSRVTVNSATAALFSIKTEAVEAKNTR